MTKIEVISLVTGIIAFSITLFQVGYAFGKHRIRKERKAAEHELIANGFREILDSVNIKKVMSDLLRVSPGQTISITLTISSKAACRLEVWIGASLVHHSRHNEYYDARQDTPAMLESGIETYRRSLTIPSDIVQGDYLLIAAVWLGKRGNPEKSYQLASHQQAEVIKIRNN
jgi:hypothetical protein